MEALWLTPVDQTDTMLGPIELNRTLQYHSLYTVRIDEIEDHRNLGCFFYDLCLKVAAVKNWRSFTCKYCPHFTVDSDGFQTTNFIT
ncbi:MAG: hypothetical protein JXD19_10855 [Deltaproteobacteria bacterium]|nr:hypothetical protein [Deltaproteobacteria bacterium]